MYILLYLDYMYYMQLRSSQPIHVVNIEISIFPRTRLDEPIDDIDDPYWQIQCVVRRSMQFSFYCWNWLSLCVWYYLFFGGHDCDAKARRSSGFLAAGMIHSRSFKRRSTQLRSYWYSQESIQRDICAHSKSSQQDLHTVEHQSIESSENVTAGCWCSAGIPCCALLLLPCCWRLSVSDLTQATVIMLTIVLKPTYVRTYVCVYAYIASTTSQLLASQQLLRSQIQLVVVGPTTQYYQYLGTQQRQFGEPIT